MVCSVVTFQSLCFRALDHSIEKLFFSAFDTWFWQELLASAFDQCFLRKSVAKAHGERICREAMARALNKTKSVFGPGLRCDHLMSVFAPSS